MNIENGLELNNNLNNKNDLSNEQNVFLSSMLGKAINKGLDFGLRAILPDFVEEQVIDVKDSLLNFGLKEGISKAIEGAINLGKSAIGVLTGNFENVSQMQTAVKQGEVMDNLSSSLDSVIDKISDNKAVDSEVTNSIKQGKNNILNSVESNIDKSFSKQLNIESNLETYMNNWKDAYKNQNFKDMEKEFKKIKKELKNLVPLENSIKEARIIENIHTLIKNNGQNFDLSKTEQELVNKLY